MPFTTPLALLGLLFIPAVVAMYLLKLRRDEAVVPSTLLWTRLVADVEANAPWQRLRRSLLLLIQLLLVLALALLAARPFLERPAGLARDIVLVIDTSASMAATDVVPDRLTAAKQVAVDALRDLPTGGKVSVIAADRSARIVVNESADLSRVRQAIDGIEVTRTRGDLGDALELASKLAARSGDAQVLVATDAALATAVSARVRAPVKVLAVGRERRNQAIVALAVRTSPSAVTRSVFISIANLDLEAAARRVELWGDDQLLEVRDVKLDPQARSDVIIDDLKREVRTVEVRLVGADPAVTGPPDRLAVDDRAWAVIPPDRTRLILVVGEGDPYLETALSYLPDVELYGVPPSDYGPKTERTDGRPWDLIIFEGFLPATLPRTPVLAIAPPRSSALGDVTGKLTDPGIGTLAPDEPVLRYVDLSTTHISEAVRLATPSWARTIVPGPRGAPLLYAGPRDGVNSAVLAFEPRRSDLPLQVAFPILVANLTGELLGSSTAPTEAVEPGTPVVLNIPAGAIGLQVTRPDGATTDLVPGSTGAGSAVTYAATDLLGIYTVTPVVDAAASPAPSGGASGGASPSVVPSPSSTPSAAPSGSGAAAAPPAVDPLAPVRFAVDLFDVNESTIAPGSPAAIEALGSAGGPSASPGTGGSGGGTAVERPTARDELWVPIVLLVLAALCVEWAVYHRDGLIRARRGLLARLRRDSGGST
ncbi:MAG TPA: BatA and WFA domain-containing protein [Candidatus Limnocylindrales bacterium]|nr:BatA and WFA domain-containing protein [Candidatus Limnocylindrales bacterium]